MATTLVRNGVPVGEIKTIEQPKAIGPLVEVGDIVVGVNRRKAKRFMIDFSSSPAAVTDKYRIKIGRRTVQFDGIITAVETQSDDVHTVRVKPVGAVSFVPRKRRRRRA